MEKDTQHDVPVEILARNAKQRVCKHRTGYWIHKSSGNFRCYECGSQFHIGDNLPANHPTKGIEVWFER